MKKIAVIVNELGVSQLSYFVINSMNAFLEANPGADGLVLFYQNASACAQPYFATMPINCIHSYHGDVITTDLDTTQTAIKYGHKPIFYVNDLEWIRGRIDFNTNVALYRQANRLICRSADHANALAAYAGVDNIEVMPVFNVGALVR